MRQQDKIISFNNKSLGTLHTKTGLSATFEVGGASARVAGEIDYFLVGALSKMCKIVKK